jgi:hypothetical protein
MKYINSNSSILLLSIVFIIHVQVTKATQAIQVTQATQAIQVTQATQAIQVTQTTSTIITDQVATLYLMSYTENQNTTYPQICAIQTIANCKSLSPSMVWRLISYYDQSLLEGITDINNAPIITTYHMYQSSTVLDTCNQQLIQICQSNTEVATTTIYSTDSTAQIVNNYTLAIMSKSISAITNLLQYSVCIYNVLHAYLDIIVVHFYNIYDIGVIQQCTNILYQNNIITYIIPNNNTVTLTTTITTIYMNGVWNCPVDGQCISQTSQINGLPVTILYTINNAYSYNTYNLNNTYYKLYSGVVTESMLSTLINNQISITTQPFQFLQHSYIIGLGPLTTTTTAYNINISSCIEDFIIDPALHELLYHKHVLVATIDIHTNITLDCFHTLQLIPGFLLYSNTAIVDSLAYMYEDQLSIPTIDPVIMITLGILTASVFLSCICLGWIYIRFCSRQAASRAASRRLSDYCTTPALPDARLI